MKKIIRFIGIISLLCITGCSPKEPVYETGETSHIADIDTMEKADIQEDFIEKTAEKSVEEAKKPEIEDKEQESEEVSITEEQIERLQFWLDEYRPPLKDENAEILQLSGNLVLNMDESCYPELRESLRLYSEQVWEYWGYGSYRVIVHRADKRALSFLEERSGDGFCVRGFNFNPETGKNIELSSVVNNMDRLVAVIANQLVSRYPDIQLGDNPAERIMQLCSDSAVSAWTISYHGLCFYFSPEALGSKEGMFHAVVPFSDMPELFDKKYQQIPEAYAIELEEDIPFLYDLDNDGSADLIKAFFYPDDEQLDTGLQVNDRTGSGKYEGWGWAYYDENRRIYLLHMAENKNYIVFYERGDLDCTGKYGVYTYEGGNIKYLGSDMIYLDDGRITDPDSVWLINSAEPLLSGIFRTETEYFVNESVFLEAYDTIYYYLDTDREFRTLIELSVSTVDPYTGDILKSDVTLPPDTFIEPLRTDLYTWCDFVLEDGRVCRIVFDASLKDSWGIPEYEGKNLVGECISAHLSETKITIKYSDN